MAPPVAGGDQRPPIRFPGHPFPAKRRTLNDPDDDSGDDDHNARQKRRRYPQYADPVPFMAVDKLHGFSHLHPSPQPHPYPHPRSHRSSPEPGPCSMERTASGHSIQSDPIERCALTELLEDEEAAQRVREHMAAFRRRSPDSKHERILRSIINPRAEYPLDNDALESIFSAANEIFFNGRLSQRVMWDWSHESSGKYDSKVIGTTALRRASTRGFETLIVLSSPILRDTKYSRRLLISTFLHELIHSYLFICCGFRARNCGGHTPGFQTIAKLVDNWVGPESGLYLGCMEADLERFRVYEEEEDIGGRFGGGAERIEYAAVSFPCSGLSEEQHDYPDLGSRDHHYNDTDSKITSNSNTVTTWWTQRAVRPLPLLNEDIPAYYTFCTNNSPQRL